MPIPSDKPVAYFYDEEIGNYCYGGGNPMRPHRARMAYALVDSYGLTKKMIVHRPRARTYEDLTEFHADGECLAARARRHVPASGPNSMLQGPPITSASPGGAQSVH